MQDHTRRFVAAWSHGVSLELVGRARPQAWRDQQIDARMPWTPGFGLGVRVTDALDVRAEVKQHACQRFPTATTFGGAAIARYRTTTVGVGAYYRWRPFTGRRHALRGLLIVPSVRYWPNVASTLAGDSLVYRHPATARTEVHRAASQGLPGTGGLLLNVGVGYVFGTRRAERCPAVTRRRGGDRVCGTGARRRTRRRGAPASRSPYRSRCRTRIRRGMPIEFHSLQTGVAA